jgi:hypothetical protein
MTAQDTGGSYDRTEERASSRSLQDASELAMDKTTLRLLAVLSLPCAACGPPREGARNIVPTAREAEQTAERAETPNEKAIQIWSKHAAGMESAFAGERRNVFVPACSFFTTLTGIPIRVDGDFVGPLPSAETREDWAKVQAWYSQNQARLYWDEAAGAVRVGPR